MFKMFKPVAFKHFCRSFIVSYKIYLASDAKGSLLSLLLANDRIRYVFM